MLCNGLVVNTPLKCPFLLGYLHPIEYMVPRTHPSPQPKRDLDRSDKQTDRQTDPATRSVTIAASTYVVLRRGLKRSAIVRVESMRRSSRRTSAEKNATSNTKATASVRMDLRGSVRWIVPTWRLYTWNVLSGRCPLNLFVYAVSLHVSLPSVRAGEHISCHAAWLLTVAYPGTHFRLSRISKVLKNYYRLLHA